MNTLHTTNGPNHLDYLKDIAITNTCRLNIAIRYLYRCVISRGRSFLNTNQSDNGRLEYTRIEWKYIPE